MDVQTRKQKDILVNTCAYLYLWVCTYENSFFSLINIVELNSRPEEARFRPLSGLFFLRVWAANVFFVILGVQMHKGFLWFCKLAAAFSENQPLAQRPTAARPNAAKPDS